MAGTTLGTAYVQIVPSAQGIKGSISNVLGGEAASAGEASGKSLGSNIVSFAKKAIVAGAIGKVIKTSLDEGAALQQSYFGGLDTLYGDAADAARKYAREAASAGISMNEYSEQAVSFGAALKNAYGGDVTKAAEAANTAIMDMADNSAKMGTDIESVQMAYQGFAKQNYTMLDNLKLGYGGTKTEMERLLADAQELTGVEYNIDNLGDVYDAIHVIQGELGLTGVAADEASETFSGSFNAMKASAKNLLGSLAVGENVAPAMTQLATSVSTFFFKNFIPMIGTMLKSLPPAILAFLQVGVPQLLSGIVGVLSSLATSIKAKADSITSKDVTAWATTTLPKVLKAAGTIIKKFASGLITNLPAIARSLGKIGLTIVKGLGSALWSKVKQAAEGIKERFLAPINNLKDKIKGIIDTIKGFFSFNVSAPHIPLPHFSISPAGWKLGDLLKGVKPSLSISWYKKAEDTPYIFRDATLFGAGERNDEMLYGRSALMRDIREASGGGGDIIINLNYDADTDATDMVRDIARGIQRYKMAGAF